MLKRREPDVKNNFERERNAPRTTRNSFATRARVRGMLLSSTGLIMVSAMVIVLLHEMYSSKSQARYFSEVARQLTFQVEPRVNPAAYFPSYGPYDERLGYVQLPFFLSRLEKNGYQITDQARLSPRLKEIVNEGVFPIYKEKTQAGLTILDRRGGRIFERQYPERAYAYFKSIPNLMVAALLYIENRELLDNQYPERNPAVEWDRLLKVSGDALFRALFSRDHKLAGGSTLATQIEKYRHSPDGITGSPREKLRQMMSAAYRAYMDGEQTYESRKNVVRDYVNSVPLAARAGYGEVNGIGDGLWAWYGTDFWTADALLSTEPPQGSEQERERARVFKQVVSLFLAQRRPSYYLLNLQSLSELVDTYLDLFIRDGVISPEFAEIVRAQPLEFKDEQLKTQYRIYLQNKAANAVRMDLLNMFGVKHLYELDRFDATITSTLDRDIQADVSSLLIRFRDKEFAKKNGMYGHHLLEENDDLEKIVLSFTLFERTAEGNVVRVQADNYDQPLDINQGIKLDLGSSAKLRTLISYLDVVAGVHQKHSGKSSQDLARLPRDPRDHLGNWTIDYLTRAPNTTLAQILDAAVERPYSANPGERFFTGGGLHSFANFKREDNGKVLSVREAVYESVNLVFIRMMRDVINHFTYQPENNISGLLSDLSDPRRQTYLARFADREGSAFMRSFYRKYRGLSPEDALNKLAEGVKIATPRAKAQRLSIMLSSVKSNVTFDEFKQFVQPRLDAGKLKDEDLQRIFVQYTPANYTFNDRGYLARVHPLELWLVSYLYNNPKATLTEALSASAFARQESYQWLFKGKKKTGQNNRIYQELEREAFEQLHRQWKKLGYPFNSLVPSLATSIGSSADRPAALAELMGIILNDGKRMPSFRIDRLHFADRTPYETIVERAPADGEQVVAPELTATVRRTLLGVVEKGTARRIFGAFVDNAGNKIPLGGKTGTGDHRLDTVDRFGRIVKTEVRNRATTFAFFLGDRFFGTVTAFVPGADAANYSFTSSLPVQLLKVMAPRLKPLVGSPALVIKRRLPTAPNRLATSVPTAPG